jgi:hypothetical protein
MGMFVGCCCLVVTAVVIREAQSIAAHAHIIAVTRKQAHVQGMALAHCSRYGGRPGTPSKPGMWQMVMVLMLLFVWCEAQCWPSMQQLVGITQLLQGFSRVLRVSLLVLQEGLQQAIVAS